MSKKYNVSSVEIEGGVITAEFCCKAESIKGFFEEEGRKPFFKKIPVTGWKMKAIYLTQGNESDGFGWGFFK